jgi:hypothetical protein
MRPGWHQVKATDVNTLSLPDGPQDRCYLWLPKPSNLYYKACAASAQLGGLKIGGCKEGRSRFEVFVGAGDTRSARRPPARLWCDRICTPSRGWRHAFRAPAASTALVRQGWHTLLRLATRVPRAGRSRRRHWRLRSAEPAASDGLSSTIVLFAPRSLLKMGSARCAQFTSFPGRATLQSQ